MSAIDYYKEQYCHFCPVKTQCSQSNLELFNCMLKTQMRLTKKLGELEGVKQ